MYKGYGEYVFDYAKICEGCDWEKWDVKLGCGLGEGKGFDG